MDAKTYLNNDYNDYVNAGGGAQVADWDPALVRYIFLDADNGDDSHVGYIDAPPGTVFSPADVAAVAVQTTHRINQIRPPVGAGRMVAVLIKPRTGSGGGAVYDHALPGDHRGQDDRSRINGYSYMLTRGSHDLTNSRLDKTSLGYGVALAGPNDDQSFTVESVAVNGDNTLTLTLTGAALPAGYILARFRMRTNVVVYSNVVAYAAVRWGELAALPDPTKVVIWDPGVPMNPGDKVWFEEPKARLFGIFEAAGAQSKNQQADLVTAGLCVSDSRNQLGSNDAFRVQYSHCHFVGNAGAYCYADDCPIEFIPGWIDETGNQSPGSVCGVLFPTFTQLAGVHNDYWLQTCTYAVNGGPIDDPFWLFVHGDSVLIQQSVLQAYKIECEGGLSGLDACLVGNASALNEGEISFTNVRRIPFWVNRSTILRAGVDQGATLYNLGASSAAWGPEPDLAGYDVYGIGARYTVRVDLDVAQPGQRIDFVPANNVVIPLGYSQTRGLGMTGFELETGVKFVVHKSLYTAPEIPTPYAGDELPCPVCRLMQFTDTEGGPEPIETPPGLIVSASVAQENRVEVSQLLYATAAGILSPIGVTVSPSISTPSEGGQIGGFVLVAFKGPLVVQLAAASPYPEPNAPLYADTDFAGYAAGVPNDPRSLTGDVVGPRLIGRVMPSGWPGEGGQTAYITWEPGDQSSQVAMQTPAFPFEKTDANLADVPGAFAVVHSGHVYSFEALLFASFSTAGGKVALGGTATGEAFVYHEAWDLAAIVPTPIVSQHTTSIGDVPVSYANADTAVAWKIKGFVRVATDGYLQLRFAQNATDAGAPSTVVTSCLTVTEQE
jgi:hypothetical protein